MWSLGLNVFALVARAAFFLVLIVHVQHVLIFASHTKEILFTFLTTAVLIEFFYVIIPFWYALEANQTSLVEP